MKNGLNISGPFIGWIVHILVWTFFSGGAYFMLKNHEIRLEKIEDNYVLKSDWKESNRSIWERLRDVRSPYSRREQ